MRKFLLVFLLLFTALVLRLYPHFISGLPFSTDAWPPIRNTELLLEHTPVPLNEKVFDGYNNYYPVNSVFGALMAQVIGVKAIDAMGFFLPVTGAMSILIFYAVVRRLYGSRIGFMASIIFSTAYTHVIFTAGVTKETYGSPLYILLIFVFLHPKLGRLRQLLLFTLASLTLVSTHHLTSLIAVIVLSSMALANFINSQWKGVKSEKTRVILPLILFAATALYYWLYASEGFKVPLTLSDWLSAASYQILAFALASHLSFKPIKRSFRKVFAESLVALTVTFLMVILTTRRSLTPGAPILPSRYLLYGSPFIIASPLIVLGHGGLKRVRGIKDFSVLFWLAAVMGLEGYAVFGGSSLGYGLAYRTVNFLQPPLAVLTAIGLDKIYKASKRPYTKKLTKLVVVSSLLAITILSSYSVYAAIDLQERYMGYFWLYKIQEYEAAAWVANTLNNQHVAGDVKVSFLLKGYFNIEVDTLQGLRYLNGRGSEPPILFLYSQMLENGYVLGGGYSIDLPRNWTERTLSLNHIYSNRLVNVHTESTTH